MEADFWHQRWKEGRIGFHQSQANPMLVEHWHKLKLSSETPVFVPLCGKSQDLIWLNNRGHPVIGVELNRAAIEAFDRENNMRGSWLEQQGLSLYHSGGIRIWQADFFDLGRQQLGEIAAIFDRAALIALPKSMRQRYCDHINSLSNKHCKQLLISLEYEHTKRTGPPFSIDHAEIESLYKGWEMQLLEQKGIPDKPGNAKDCAYRLRN